MARATKPKPKLIDLFHDWTKAMDNATSASSKMSITPALMKAEEETYNIFYEALKKCNC